MAAPGLWIAVLVISLSVLTACSQDENPNSSGTTAAAAKHDENRGMALNPSRGADIYAASCASCHDSGVAGAPAIGDQAAWSQRSRLWTAVLSEHAKHGYLKMPSKGGDPSLSETNVAAASEYMLSQTYPDLPQSD